MPGRMEQAIDQTFSTPVVTVCRQLLGLSYSYARQSHLTEAGANDATFGFNLYWYNVHQFATFAEGADVGIQVTSTRPEFRLTIGEFTVACHRVGSTASDPIDTCFPRNPNGPGRLAAQNAVQLCLDLPIEEDPSIPSNVILAHLGNPTDGLQALYVAVPAGTSTGGRVNEWRYTKSVWKAPSAVHVSDVPGPVDITPPTLSFKRGVLPDSIA